MRTVTTAAFLAAVAWVAAGVSGCGGGGGGGGGGFVGSIVDPTKSTVSVDRPAGVIPNGTDFATVTVTVRDSNGNLVTNAPVTLAATGGGTSITNVTSFGVGNVTSSTPAVQAFRVTSTTPGTKVITATATPSGSATGTTIAQTVTIAFAPTPVTNTPTGTTVTITPAQTIADNSNAATLSVQARDATGAVIPGATVTFATSAPGVTIANATVTTDANGIATTTVRSTVAAATVINITVQNGSGTPIVTTTGTITFIAGPPSQIIFLTQPGTVTAGDDAVPPSPDLCGPFMSPGPQVAIADQFGNVVPGRTDLIELRFLQNGVDIGQANGATQLASNGVATFTRVARHTVGTYQLLAKSRLFGSATSNAFSVVAGPVRSFAPAGLAFIGAVQNTISGTAVVASAALVDRFGNVVPTAGVPVTFTSANANATLPGSPVVVNTNGNGIALLNAVITGTTGNAQLTATTGTGATMRTATSNVFQVNVAPLSAATDCTNPLAVGTSGQATTITVTVTDSTGAAVAGEMVTASINTAPVNSRTSATGTITGGVTTVATNGQGRAIFSLTFDVAGTYTLDFTPVTTTFALGDTCPVTINPGTATGVVILDYGVLGASSCPDEGQPRNGDIGQNLGPINVAAVDAAGNITSTPVTAVTLNVTGSPANVILNGGAATNTVNGIARFNNVTVTENVAGAARGSNFTLTTTNNQALVNDTSTAFKIRAPVGTAGQANASSASTRLAFSVNPPGVYINRSFQYTVEAVLLDSAGNIVTGDNTTTVQFVRFDPDGANGFTIGLNMMVTATAGRAVITDVPNGTGLSTLGVTHFYTATTTNNLNMCAVSAPFEVVPDPAISSINMDCEPVGGPSTPQTQTGLVIGSTERSPTGTIPANIAPGPFYQVSILERNAELISSSSAPVTVFISNATTAVLTGTTTVNAVNGVATFSNLVLTGTPQAVQLTFVSPGSTNALVRTINLTN